LQQDPSNGSKKARGALHFRERARSAPSMFWVQGVCSDARMLAPAKARIRREWDLVSLIGCIKTHRMAARKLGVLSISARALAVQCACQEWMQFSNQSSDAWRSGCVLQWIHTRFSQRPDVMQGSTDWIWQLHLYFQQSESKLPTAFMTGCSNTKSWMKAETWVDDRLWPCQHISLVPLSHIFIEEISTRVGEQWQYVSTCFLVCNFLFCNLTS
jgi:hypothetical protein